MILYLAVLRWHIQAELCFGGNFRWRSRCNMNWSMMHVNVQIGFPSPKFAADSKLKPLGNYSSLSLHGSQFTRLASISLVPLSMQGYTDILCCISFQIHYQPVSWLFGPWLGFYTSMICTRQAYHGSEIPECIQRSTHHIFMPSVLARFYFCWRCEEK